MRLFFLQEKAKKAPDWLNAQVDQKSIEKAAVLGAGAMGGGIALLLARKGIWTRLKDIKPEFLSVGMQEIRKLLKKDTKRRKLTKLQAEQALDHVRPTLD
jgi:3-hydroxyacyl-CoA dehydrogenase